MSDDYNMSMRKFLKQVGVTSQHAIEDALREAPARTDGYTVRAVITIEDLGLTHEITGTIKSED